VNLKNIFWNLGGLGTPALAAAITIPWIIHFAGLERFGLLSIAWGLIATSGLFDLGIGRATTQHVAKLIGLQQHSQISPVISLAATMTLVTGLFAGGLFALAILCGVQDFLKTTPEIISEVKLAGLILAATLPLQAVAATYRGINEAYSDFRGISMVRVLLGVINFGGTLLVSVFCEHLAALVAVLFFSRLMGIFIFRWLARTHVEEAVKHSLADDEMDFDHRSVARQLLSFGSWFTLGSGVSFVLDQSEKLGIGVLVSATAISTFAIPFEVVVQSLVVTTAISTIAFPKLSSLVQSDPAAALKKFHQWMLRTMGVMLLICVLMVFALPPVLKLWVGENLPAGIFADRTNSLSRRVCANGQCSVHVDDSCLWPGRFDHHRTVGRSSLVPGRRLFVDH
jgi:O-antigen/teichoic acid export membrane protein